MGAGYLHSPGNPCWREALEGGPCGYRPIRCPSGSHGLDGVSSLSCPSFAVHFRGRLPLGGDWCLVVVPWCLCLLIFLHLGGCGRDPRRHQGCPLGGWPGGVRPGWAVIGRAGGCGSDPAYDLVGYPHAGHGPLDIV